MSKNKELIRLKKKCSKYIIVIEPSDIDSNNELWFLDFKTVVKKTGKTNKTSIITKKDLSNWLNYYLETLGWVVDYIDDSFEKEFKEITPNIK